MTKLKTANGCLLKVMGYSEIEIKFRSKTKMVRTVVVTKGERKLILGMNFWNLFELEIIVQNENIYSMEEAMGIRTELPLDPDQEYELQKSSGIFRISSELICGRTYILEYMIELLERAKPLYGRACLFGFELEERYAAVEQEALDVILAIEQFRCHVYGSPCTVITDTSALAYIYKKQKDGSSRLGRLALSLSQYQVEIKHTAGRESVVPNALSTAVCSIKDTPIENTDKWYVQFKKQVEEDLYSNPEYELGDNELWIFVRLEEEIGVISFRWREIIQRSRSIQVMTEVNDQLSHLGPGNCSNVMKDLYYWPRMRQGITKDMTE